MKVCLFLSSVRPNRLNIPVANIVRERLLKRNYEVTIIDPATENLEVLTMPLHFRDYKTAPENLLRINNTIKAADGYIMVTPEYNRNIPPALTNLLDHFPGTSFAFRPAGIVTYSPSGFGGCCAGQQLRALVNELGMLSLPNIAYLREVTAGMKDGVVTNDSIIRAIDFMVDQFDWVIQACKSQRNQTPHPRVQPYLPEPPADD